MNRCPPPPWKSTRCRLRLRTGRERRCAYSASFQADRCDAGASPGSTKRTPGPILDRGRARPELHGARTPRRTRAEGGAAAGPDSRRTRRGLTSRSRRVCSTLTIRCQAATSVIAHRALTCLGRVIRASHDRRASRRAVVAVFTARNAERCHVEPVLPPERMCLTGAPAARYRIRTSSVGTARRGSSLAATRKAGGASAGTVPGTKRGPG